MNQFIKDIQDINNNLLILKEIIVEFANVWVESIIDQKTCFLIEFNSLLNLLIKENDPNKKFFILMKKLSLIQDSTKYLRYHSDFLPETKLKLKEKREIGLIVISDIINTSIKYKHLYNFLFLQQKN